MPTKTKKVSQAVKKVAKKSVKKPVKKSPQKPLQKVIYRFEKRFAFIPHCSNCEHIPMRINRLVALMTILVAVLSGIVLAQQQPLAVDRAIVNAVNALSQKS